MNKTSLDSILTGKEVSRGEKIRLVMSLSLPVILAQLTTIAMQYIDAGMVGSLGAAATASIGLVSSSTWLIGGSCIGIAAGFYVQVAQLIGAGREKEAEDVLRQGLKTAALCGLLISLVCLSLSGRVPYWLGGEEAILKDSTAYFRIYCLSIPFILLRQISNGMMQSTGDMKTPSSLSALLCLLNVILNFLMILPSRTISLMGMQIFLPGAGLKVVGAALATALSETIISLTALYFLSFRNKKISLKKGGSWKWKRQTLANAVKIAVPLSLDQIFMCSAYVAGTKIVAGLGTVAVAAHSLAITAESLCYMPGYGIGAAATAIIGQTIGADRRDLTKSFSRVSVYLGMAMMGLTGVIMYFAAPFVFSLLTVSREAAALGTRVLRIELISEPLYGASICCAGVFRGAGDTLRPSAMNLFSMWCVRIGLA
ncbi:MAG: MATE family efflux transporter, partial [Lachnospiraceae bacterium]|nr:MATE family efflux transporter [Lachnospiraceae bacterium]